MKPFILCSYKMTKKEDKDALDIPCKKQEIRLKKCLKGNNYDIKYCNDLRMRYELCLLKNKEYKTIMKD
jgi:hypothetical protein